MLSQLSKKQEGTFYNAYEGRCTLVARQCPGGYYIAREALSDSDIICAKCPSCPLGFYRDPDDCRSDRSLANLFIACENCALY
jgi:hypothetical protein